MPEENSAKESQTTSDGTAIKTGDSSAGETHSSKSQSEGSESQADDKSFSQADLDKYAEKVRREEKRKFEQQLKDAQLSEAERTTKRVQELEKEIRQRDARQTVVEAARKAGASNPEAVYALSRAMLEWNDGGQLSNLRDAVDYARETAPELFPKRPGSGNGGEGQNAGSFSQNMNDLIRRSAGRQ